MQGNGTTLNCFLFHCHKVAPLVHKTKIWHTLGWTIQLTNRWVEKVETIVKCQAIRLPIKASAMYTARQGLLCNLGIQKNYIYIYTETTKEHEIPLNDYRSDDSWMGQLTFHWAPPCTTTPQPWSKKPHRLCAAHPLEMQLLASMANGL